MAMVIDANNGQATRAAMEKAVEVAKAAGLYDKRPDHQRAGEHTWLELMEWCEQFGRGPSTRVVVKAAPAWDLGPHAFYLSFQHLSNDASGAMWAETMNGGTVYRAGEGWSIHT